MNAVASALPAWPSTRADVFSSPVKAAVVMAVFLAMGFATWKQIHPNAPAASHGKISAKDILTLRLDVDGKCSVGNEKVSDDELRALLREFRTLHRNAAVRVTTPRDLTVPCLLELMNLLKSAGIEHTSVDTSAP